MSGISNESFVHSAVDAAYPREACGLVYDGLAYEITNVARGNGFFIPDQVEYTALWNKLGRPQGVWHSHPNGDPTPSESDIHYHPKDMVMYIVAEGVIYEYGPTGS